jgi:hypothetical protein
VSTNVLATEYYENMLNDTREPAKYEPIGPLEYSNSLEEFSGTLEVLGRLVEVALRAFVGDGPRECEGLDASPETRARVLSLLERMNELARLATEQVCDRMLKLKNGTWLRPDEQPLSRDEFRGRLALEEVGIDPASGLTFCFNDGDMFWDHVIMIDREPGGQFQEPYLYG